MESSFTDSHVDVKTEEGFALESDTEMRSSCKDSTFMFENESRHIGATPFTYITEKICKPDLAVYCSNCDEYIDAKTLKEHRFLHRSLDLFQYNFSTLPNSTHRLLLRRNVLIRKLCTENIDRESEKTRTSTDEKVDVHLKFKEINKSFEFLKSLFEDTYEQCRRVVDLHDTKVTSRLLNSNSESIQVVAMCTSANERWKNCMEDRHVYQDSFGGDDGKTYMAIFDGHHGDYSAQISAAEMHRLLLVEMAKFDDTVTAPVVEAMRNFNLNCPPRPHTTGSQRRQMYKESVNIIEAIRVHCEEKFERFMALRSREQDVSVSLNGNISSAEVIAHSNYDKGDDTSSSGIIQGCNTKNGKETTMHKSVSLTYGAACAKRAKSSIVVGRNVIKGNKSKTYERNDHLVHKGLSHNEFIDHTVPTNFMDNQLAHVNTAKERKIIALGVPNDKVTAAINMADAFHKVYHLIDILLGYGTDEASKVRWSGTSAASLVLEDLHSTDRDKYQKAFGLAEREETGEVVGEGCRRPRCLLHVANAGNVHAILIKNNAAQRLTRDHTCSNLRERRRVKAHGGTLSMSNVDCRVNSILATTRGLGNHGDLKLKRCVIPDPFTTVVPIDDDAQILLVASHGLWSVFSEQEVAAILLKILPCNHVPRPERIHSSIRELLSCKSRQLSPASSRIAKRGNNRRGRTNQTNLDKSFTSNEILKIYTQTWNNSGNKDKGDRRDDDQSISRITRKQSLASDTTISLESRRHYVAKWMAEDLVQAALLAGSKENITVMIALLPGCDI